MCFVPYDVSRACGYQTLDVGEVLSSLACLLGGTEGTDEVNRWADSVRPGFLQVGDMSLSLQCVSMVICQKLTELSSLTVPDYSRHQLHTNPPFKKTDLFHACDSF